MEISTLGGLEIKLNGQPLTRGMPRKAEALLIYLVCAEQPQAREILADLLWDERTQAQARHHLRVTLSRLNQVLPPYIISTRHTLTFDATKPYWLDIAELETVLAQVKGTETLPEALVARLAEGLDYYRGDFLAGFHLSEALGFETWLVTERERLRYQTLEGYQRLVAAYLEQAQYTDGIEAATRWLALDSLDEIAHGQMMRLLVLNGQRNAALGQYETCRQTMLAELGVEPTGELVALAEQIRTGTLSRAIEPQASRGDKEAPSGVIIDLGARDPEAPPEPDPLLTLTRLDPLPDQHLFGVERVQEQLSDRLQAPGRPWLVAIDGLGGLGKTTLANQLAHTFIGLDRFYDIAWVSAKQTEFLPEVGLQTTGRPALDGDTLTEALLEQLTGQTQALASSQERRLALTRLLKDKATPYLIIVDNLETVVDIEALIPYLRQLANPSKFLLTSRFSLKLYADVYSLSLNELSQADTIAFLTYEAEARGLTALSQATPDQLARIYAAVGGNPLALKLVIGQMNFLPLGAILDNLKGAEGKQIEALYTYIYWQAWQVLSEAGRHLLLVMPFMSGSTLAHLAAASDLATEDLHPALTQLITLSLIQVGGDLETPRYHLHRLTETFLMQEVLKWQSLP